MFCVFGGMSYSNHMPNNIFVYSARPLYLKFIMIVAKWAVTNRDFRCVRKIAKGDY